MDMGYEKHPWKYHKQIKMNQLSVRKNIYNYDDFKSDYFLSWVIWSYFIQLRKLIFSRFVKHWVPKIRNAALK